MEFDQQNISLLLPEILISISAMVMLIWGVFSEKIRPYTSRLSVFLLCAVFVIIVVEKSTGLAFGNLFIQDNIAIFAKALICFALVFVIILTENFQRKIRKIASFEYYILMLLSVVGMFMMISANNILIAYLGIELQSLALYVLAAADRKRLKSTEAGLKYFILGALASSLLLFGCSYIYGVTGSLQFDGIADFISSNSASNTSVILLLGLVLVLVGLFFKLSVAPFHMWSPDVYTGVPTPVTAFFATVPKIAGVVLLIRILNQVFYDFAAEWQQILYVVSVLSMLVGAFGALRQQNIKRLLAYSSVGHIGFILIGVLVNTESSISYLLNYLTIYIFMNVLAFAIIMVICNRYIDKTDTVQELKDFTGLSKKHPLLAFGLSVAMLSMAGIPPLAGFFAKFYLFLAAVDEGYYLLVVIGLLSSVIAAFYYIKVVKIMYFDEPTKDSGKKTQILLNKSGRAIIIACVAFNVFYFIVPSFISKITDNATIGLFQ